MTILFDLRNQFLVDQTILSIWKHKVFVFKENVIVQCSTFSFFIQNHCSFLPACGIYWLCRKLDEKPPPPFFKNHFIYASLLRNLVFHCKFPLVKPPPWKLCRNTRYPYRSVGRRREGPSRIILFWSPSGQQLLWLNLKVVSDRSPMNK